MLNSRKKRPANTPTRFESGLREASETGHGSLFGWQVLFVD